MQASLDLDATEHQAELWSEHYSSGLQVYTYHFHKHFNGMMQHFYIQRFHEGFGM